MLEARDLRVRFGAVDAVAGVSFDVAPGEAVGIVGESGSGKSATVLAAMRLHPRAATVSAERLKLDGHDVLTLAERPMRDLRGRVAAMVFQDPLTALNPLMAVGAQVAEVITRHRGVRGRAAREAAIRLLDQVGIADARGRADQHPHAFSGGQRQRVMIASALASEPRLLIADEPTTALDVTVQASLTRLIADLRRERNLALVWVTHDLALMAGVVDRVIVMYAGRIVETAPVDVLYATPRHPYTAALLASLPRLDRPRPARAGQPYASVPAGGCAFAPRCAHRFAACDQAPPMLPSGQTAAACWLLAAGA